MFHLVTTRFRDNRLRPIVLPSVCVASTTLPDVAGNNGEVCDCVGFARERNASKGIPCRLPLRGKSLMSFRGAASIGGLGGSRFVAPPKFYHQSFRAAEVMH